MSLWTEAAAAEMVRLSGQRGVPVTVIDGRAWWAMIARC